jgi:hypothetical protein
MAVKMDNLTTMMEDLHLEFNKTQAVSEMDDDVESDYQEALKNNMNLMLDKVISSIDKNANNFMNKVRKAITFFVFSGTFYCSTKTNTKASKNVHMYKQVVLETAHYLLIP